MYRYSQQMRGNAGGQRIRQQATKVLTIVLLLAMIVLAILAGGAMNFENKEQSLYKERMKNEATLAITQVNNLSRTGESTTANLLGKLRQHVYAMQTLQEVHVLLRGKGQQAVDTSMFENIYSVIDNFDEKLQTGQQTKEPQAQLLSLLTDMSNTVNGIK